MNSYETESCQGNWQISKVEVFWNKIAMYDTVFYMYNKEDNFIDLLAGFVGTGINANDCNIVIASVEHLEKLAKKLQLHGIHVSGLIEDDRYYPVDAQKLLGHFMDDDIPNEQRFITCISTIIRNARKRNRKVRTYREMAPILKIGGNETASIKLEEIWNNYKKHENLSLFCAYPSSNDHTDDCSFLKRQGIKSPKVIKETFSLSNVLYKEC